MAAGEFLAGPYNHHRRSEDRRRQHLWRDRRRRHADRAARRDRPVARRQDRVHHRARPQSRAWRPPAALRGLCQRAGSPARSSRRSPTTTCPASTTRRMCATSSRSASGRTRRAASASCASSSTTNRPLVRKRAIGRGRLNLDIVDYPGEWLLDLALLKKSYAEWSADAFTMSREPHRTKLAAEWHAMARRRRPGRAGGRGEGARAGGGLHALSAHRPRRRARSCPCCRPAASSCPATWRARPR